MIGRDGLRRDRSSGATSMTTRAPRHRESTPSTAELAISTRGLRKTYLNRKGRHVAVAGLDLDVPLGGVHGFLGPNGSGKTTTIRMLLGLIRADAGTMSIFDREVPKHLPEIVGRVGANQPEQHTDRGCLA